MDLFEVVCEAPPPDAWSALLHAARGGDESALGEICERMRRYLRVVVADQFGGGLRSKVGNSDIVQQTMLDACRNFESFLGNTEREWQAWLTRALQHNIIDVARSFRGTQCRQTTRERPLDRKAAVSDATLDCETASSIVRRQEKDEELIQAIARLSPQQQQVIEFRHRSGLSYAEIASSLGITESAARKIWSRAIAKLGRELAADDV